jgi:hypothetical protein
MTNWILVMGIYLLVMRIRLLVMKIQLLVTKLLTSPGHGLVMTNWSYHLQDPLKLIQFYSNLGITIITPIKRKIFLTVC